MRRHRVLGHGGVGLEVFDLGPETAQPILLLHGWSQHHLSWAKQYPLADRFRLIMPDLRGHGASEKPDEPTAYNQSAPWAGDVASIIAALSLERPILAGWSMGGAVACDYVKHYGDTALSGFCMIDSFATTGSHMAPDMHSARAADAGITASGMTSSDQDANLTGTLGFVRACFHIPPSSDELAKIVGFNMLCPPHVRQFARQRDEDYRPYLARLHIPALVVWGAHDRAAPPPVGAEVARAIPDARTRIYDNCGHSPFWEAPDQFNTDLVDFAQICTEMEQSA